jgi:hypothetical protein
MECEAFQEIKLTETAGFLLHHTGFPGLNAVRLVKFVKRFKTTPSLIHEIFRMLV